MWLGGTQNKKKAGLFCVPPSLCFWGFFGHHNSYYAESATTRPAERAHISVYVFLFSDLWRAYFSGFSVLGFQSVRMGDISVFGGCFGARFSEGLETSRDTTGLSLCMF